MAIHSVHPAILNARKFILNKYHLNSNSIDVAAKHYQLYTLFEKEFYCKLEFNKSTLKHEYKFNNVNQETMFLLKWS